MFIATLSLLPIALLSVLAARPNPWDIGKTLVISNLAPSPINSPLDCLVTSNGAPDPSDCHAAINLIPSGGLFFDPNSAGTNTKFDFHLPDRRRIFLLPAIFRFRTCLVAVDPGLNKTPTPSTLARPSSAMYFDIWPNVRIHAEQIVARCTNHPYTGGTRLSQIWLGNYLFSYMVTVIAVPDGFPRHGAMARLSRGTGPAQYYNVYEPEGEG